MLYYRNGGESLMKADCHIHMVLDGKDWRAAIAAHKQQPREAVIRQALSDYQALGYTYLRDGGDRWGVGTMARALAAEYGITYRTPLAPLCKAGHYGSFIGRSYNTMEEYTALVREQKRQGADFVKIMISGLMDFDWFGVLTEPGLPGEEIGELIHIAHQEGMAVMAHANGARTVQAAAEAGVDSVEHGAYLDDDALAAMEESGAVWVPTLSAVANLRGTGLYGAVEQILENTMERLSRYKGLVAPGSDAGARTVPHGAETEQTLLMQAGITQQRQAQGIKMICAKF